VILREGFSAVDELFHLVVVYFETIEDAHIGNTFCVSKDFLNPMVILNFLE